GSIELDDITPLYVESLFTLVLKTYQGANALPVALELSRRADFGAWFDGAYLNRDMVCLGCHNSEFSVTQSMDPALNRHFPVPGLFEKALFGAPSSSSVRLASVTSTRVSQSSVTPIVPRLPPRRSTRRRGRYPPALPVTHSCTASRRAHSCARASPTGRAGSSRGAWPRPAGSSSGRTICRPTWPPSKRGSATSPVSAPRC